MQAGGAGPVKRDPPEQHDARLGAGTEDDAGAVETALKALAEEPAEQPADQPVLEMNLDDVIGITAGVGTARDDRRLEGDGPRRHALAPFVEPLAPAAAAGTQIVERILPGGIAGERRVLRVDGEGFDRADRARPAPRRAGNPRAAARSRPPGAIRPARRRRASGRAPATGAVRRSRPSPCPALVVVGSSISSRARRTRASSASAAISSASWRERLPRRCRRRSAARVTRSAMT